MGMKYSPSSPPPSDLFGGGWIWAGSRLPQQGQSIEYLNGYGSKYKAVVKGFLPSGTGAKITYQGSASRSHFLLGPAEVRQYWRPDEMSNLDGWITDRLPEVGDRIVVTKSQVGSGYGTQGLIIDHKENKPGIKIVWHPDGYSAPTQGYFLRPGDKWKYETPPTQQSDLPEGENMFSASVAKTIGGFRAQVINTRNQTVVWESTEVFTDTTDDAGSVTVLGSDKASAAATEVMDKVVLDLFKDA